MRIKQEYVVGLFILTALVLVVVAAVYSPPMSFFKAGVTP